MVERGFTEQKNIVLKKNYRVSWYINSISMQSRSGKVENILPTEEDYYVFDAISDGGKHYWGYLSLIYEINGKEVVPVDVEIPLYRVKS